jgi:hypothetical protein
LAANTRLGRGEAARDFAKAARQRFQQSRAGRGRPQAARGALEDAAAQLRFDFANVLADRAGGDAQLVRRFGEAPQTARRFDGAHAGQVIAIQAFHGAILNPRGAILHRRIARQSR